MKRKRSFMFLLIVICSSLIYTQSSSAAVAPDLVSPAHNSYTHDQTPTFDWSSSFAVSYTIQIDDENTFTTPIVDENVGIFTYYTVPVESSLDYYNYFWRVGANDKGGTAWSDIWFIRIIPHPSVPSLVSPTDTLDTNDNTPFFDWDGSAYAQSYQLQVSHDYFSTFDIDIIRSVSYYQVTEDLADNVYVWRVRAFSLAGEWTSWSSSWMFTIDTEPPPPAQLLFPEVDDFLNLNTFTFDWNDPAAAVRYTLIVNDEPNYESLILAENIIESSYSLESPLDDGEYYWMVSSYDSVGNSRVSEIQSFTIDTVPPSAPELLSPSNNTITDDKTPYLAWEDSAYYYSVRYWYYDDSIHAIPRPEPYCTLPSLPDGLYSWYITAYDQAGNQVNSDTFSFKLDTLNPVMIHVPEDMELEEETSGNLLEWQFYDYTLDSVVLYCNNKEVSPVLYELFYDNLIAPRYGPYSIVNLTISIDGYAQGLYNFTLFLTDACGHTSSDTVFVTVTESATSTPTTTPEPTGEPTEEPTEPETEKTSSSFIIPFFAIPILLLIRKKRRK